MDIQNIKLSKDTKPFSYFILSILSKISSGKTSKRAYYYSFCNLLWAGKLRFLVSRILLFLKLTFVIFLFDINAVYANMHEKITVLPTIKAPALLQINIEGTAQYAVKNLTQKPVTLAMIPQDGITQVATGLLACSHPFRLRPGQKCLLNLKITGHKVGQKITYGPLLCEANNQGEVKQDVSFCAQPTVEDSLNITIVEAKKAIIAVQPQLINIHAASSTPSSLKIINHSRVITAENIRAELPESWNDVKQNADDCQRVEPNGTCNIYLTAKSAHKIKTIMIFGNHTTKVPVQIRVESHDVKKFILPKES